MNKTILVLSIFLVALIFKLIKSDNSYFNYMDLKSEVNVLKEENTIYSEEIRILELEIENFKKNGRILIEEKARSELGLTKDKETFFQILK